jgi:hypothetical protein
VAPIVSAAFNQALWPTNQITPIDPGAALTTTLAGTIPVGTICYFTAFGFLTPSASSADSIYLARFTGGEAPTGLTIHGATNTASSVSVTIPAVKDSQWLVLSNVSCMNASGAPAAPVTASITSGGSTSLYSVVANQTATNPDAATYISGPRGNAADPGSTIILFGTGMGLGSSCVTTGVSAVGRNDAVLEAIIDSINNGASGFDPCEFGPTQGYTCMYH